MGRSLIILIVGIGILFTLARLRMSSVDNANVDNSVSNYCQSMARNIAKSGVEFSITQLDSNKYWRTGYSNLPIGGGTLNVTAQTIDTNRIRVRSVGSFNGNNVTIVTSVYIPQTAGSLPAAFYSGIMCDQSITLNGNVEVSDHDPNGHYNSNIHANQSVTLNGNINVKGYATYTEGSFNPNPLSKINQFLTPLWPTGGPLYSKVQRVNLPTLNVDSLKPFCDEKYDGDFTLTGNKVLGTAANPKKIYVGNNLTWDGNVSGYGIFIVKGDVTFSGNVTCNWPPPSSSNNLAIYAVQNVTFSGNVKVTAQILTLHSLTMSGNVTLVGSVASHESITLNGNVGLQYLPASAALTNFCWKGIVDLRPEITSYYE